MTRRLVTAAAGVLLLTATFIAQERRPMSPRGTASAQVLKERQWTFVVSTWPAQDKYDPTNKAALWGAYDYTPDKDVVRAPMTLETLSHAREQLTWEFLDMKADGGVLAVSWDKSSGSVAFQVGK